MYYVYLLRSTRDDRIYTGYTHDLKKRVSEYFQGNVHTTLRMGDIKLIYYEAFISEIDAREREGYLKTTKGKRTVKLMLKDTLAAIV
ncbi:MAG: GIY-YIG nuclease family protein [Candidatus Gottesmanbacteria bacterium]|nr:GIY-YIG nuclease family protein [Candidatus Gottesmanbacteria bacterium]